jgi:uncharacterized glyoxalase superfamily protein PhnB
MGEGIKLYRVILPVNDINKAAEFYGKLFGTEGERISGGRHYFNCGGTILACLDAKSDNEQNEFKPNPGYFYFSVGDLDKFLEHARSLEFLKIDERIEMRPWGERSFYAVDPFGNPVCFVEAGTEFTGGRYIP